MTKQLTILETAVKQICKAAEHSRRAAEEYRNRVEQKLDEQNAMMRQYDEDLTRFNRWQGLSRPRSSPEHPHDLLFHEYRPTSLSAIVYSLKDHTSPWNISPCLFLPKDQNSQQS